MKTSIFQEFFTKTGVKLGSNLLRAKEEPTQMNVLRGFVDYDILGSSGYEIQKRPILRVKSGIAL
jgi:hypothetical protein